MLRIHEKLREDLGQIPSQKRYLVTSHDAFHYFTRAYLCDGQEWEERCVAPEGLAPEGQLSIGDIRRVVEHLHKYRVSVVFPESNVSRAALKKIISSCGHPVKICTQPLFSDAMGSASGSAGTYLGMIEHNAKVLRAELEANANDENASAVVTDVSAEAGPTLFTAIFRLAAKSSLSTFDRCQR